MRPTFSRFDIHDLFDTLPPFVRHPMALATMASVLAHGVIAVGLPLFAGSEEKKPERVVDVISLSPAEQGKLPSNSLMMPGGGLNGTAALPLPLTKNGTFSPLSGLSGSTLGSSSSSYSGVPGLLDPPIISYTQTSPPRTNSDTGFKKSSTKILFPGFDGNKADLKFDWTKQATEQEPDHTANKDQTPKPPGAPADNLPKLDTNQGNPPETQTPQKVATNNPGTLEEAGKQQQQGQLQQPQAPVSTVAQALGQFTPGEKTKAVDQIALANAQSTTYADMFDSIANLSNSKIEELIEQPTILRPQEITLSLPIPKTSDAIPEQQQPVPAEFIVVLNTQGGLLTSPGPEGKPVLKFTMVRETGYVNLTQQALTYMQTQNAVLQESINQQVKAGKLKSFDGKYSYLKVIVKPTAATVTT
jgi:hypothetical protein